MTKKKNILLILSDQQRLDSVSAYGGSICKTPNIDYLAEKGMKFNNAFTASPICSPTRASIMTGMFAHRNGVVDNYSNIREGISTLTDYVAEEKYFRGYAGKWHVCHDITPEEFGFVGKPFMGYGFPGSGVFKGLEFNARPTNEPNYYEEYLKENGMEIPDVSEQFYGKNPAVRQEMYAKHQGPVESTIEYFVAKETMDLIHQSKEEDKPFFIWSNFWGPHSPSITPEPYFSMYDPSEIEEHPSFRDDFANKPYGHKLTQLMWGLDSYSWKDGFAEIAAKYYGHCTMIDDMVGLIIDKLREIGELENTIIIYSSDHGDCLGAHGLIEKGAFPYDEIYKVPLVVYGLGDTDNDSFVYNHEIMPTIVELAGNELNQEVDGKSLVPLAINKEETNDRKEIFGQFHSHFYNADQRMIRNKDYTFVYNASDMGELYDLGKDPYQLTNEINNPAYKSVKNELKNTLMEYMIKTDDPVRNWFKAVKEVY